MRMLRLRARAYSGLGSAAHAAIAALSARSHSTRRARRSISAPRVRASRGITQGVRKRSGGVARTVSVTSIVRTSGSLGELAQEIVAKLESEARIKRRICFPFSDDDLAPRLRARLDLGFRGAPCGVGLFAGLDLPG